MWWASTWCLWKCLCSGQVPHDHALLRQASSLLRSLPAMDSKQFKQEYIMVGLPAWALPLGLPKCILVWHASALRLNNLLMLVRPACRGLLETFAARHVWHCVEVLWPAGVQRCNAVSYDVNSNQRPLQCQRSGGQVQHGIWQARQEANAHVVAVMLTQLHHMSFKESEVSCPDSMFTFEVELAVLSSLEPIHSPGPQIRQFWALQFLGISKPWQRQIAAKQACWSQRTCSNNRAEPAIFTLLVFGASWQVRYFVNIPKCDDKS